MKDRKCFECSKLLNGTGYLCIICYSANMEAFNYKRYPNFKESEFTYKSKNGSDKDCSAIMRLSFLHCFQRFRTLINKPFIITTSFAESGHVVNSWHYKGKALDFYIKNDDSHYAADYSMRTSSIEIDLSYPDGWVSCTPNVKLLWDVWPGGLGIYPFNNLFSIHADFGPLHNEEGIRRRWYRRKNGAYENLK